MNVSEIPCYAIYSEDYHLSRDWGNKLIDLWIQTRQALVQGAITAAQFRDTLIDGIIEAADWRHDFNQAAAEVGADPDDDDLFEQYVDLHRTNAFDLIPSSLHSEFCWIPGWDNSGLDELLYDFGLKSDRWKSNYIEDVQPGRWLTEFLNLVNQSSEAVIQAAEADYGENGQKFAEKCRAANFSVQRDTSRPAILTGNEVISVIENSYYHAIPMYHCFINVKDLFEFDPTSPMKMSSTKSGDVHVGLHEFVNGGGYMDTYKGEIVIPPDAVGFAGEDRWSYGIDKVYGLVKSYFYTSPVAAKVCEEVPA